MVEHEDDIAFMTSPAEGGVQQLGSFTSGSRQAEFRKTAVKLARVDYTYGATICVTPTSASNATRKGSEADTVLNANIQAAKTNTLFNDSHCAQTATALSNTPAVLH